MKIKIDTTGHLLIERAGKYRSAVCPFGFAACRDQCALFGEPTGGYDTYAIFSASRRKNDRLELCYGKVLAGEIIDERERS